MKTIVKVFPDYCSSGLWENVSGANMDESELEHVLDTTDFIALRYWHEIWEFFIADGPASETYKQRWNEHGKQLVEEWNKKQDKVQFVYKQY